MIAPGLVTTTVSVVRTFSGLRSIAFSDTSPDALRTTSRCFEQPREQTAVTVEQAIPLLKQFKKTKFDETVNLTIHLGIDAKQADQAIRSSVSLPHGIGKSKRVIAFCPDHLTTAALNAGAIKAGGQELVAEIEKSNFSDFDVAISTPDMMRSVGKLGKILGPRGLMPNPKTGTVTVDVTR